MGRTETVPYLARAAPLGTPARPGRPQRGSSICRRGTRRDCGKRQARAPWRYQLQPPGTVAVSPTLGRGCDDLEPGAKPVPGVRVPPLSALESQETRVVTRSGRLGSCGFGASSGATRGQTRQRERGGEARERIGWRRPRHLADVRSSRSNPVEPAGVPVAAQSFLGAFWGQKSERPSMQSSTRLSVKSVVAGARRLCPSRLTDHASPDLQ